MKQKLLNLNIAKVHEALYAGPVQSVTVPSADGELTLLADHEPLITPLTAGVITIKTDTGKTKTFPIEGGTLEVSSNTATVLV